MHPVGGTERAPTRRTAGDLTAGSGELTGSGRLGHGAKSSPDLPRPPPTAGDEEYAKRPGFGKRSLTPLALQQRGASRLAVADRPKSAVDKRTANPHPQRDAALHALGLPGSASVHGSIASCINTQDQRNGMRLCFSPGGELLLSYGYGHEMQLMRSEDGALLSTLQGPAADSDGAVSAPAFSRLIRFAAFSADGDTILAASDDCHILVFSVDSAKSGSPALRADVNVGIEPVKYCLLSPDGASILSCDDLGQIEAWSVSTTQRSSVHYEPGHCSVLASFSSDGDRVLSCAESECGLVLMDAKSGRVEVSEDFEELVDGRRHQGYDTAANGRWVVVFVRDQTDNPNLAVYDTGADAYRSLRVCSGGVLDVEFSNEGDEFIAAGRDNMIHIYETQSMNCLSRLSPHDCDIMCVHMSSSHELAISGDSGGRVYVSRVGGDQEGAGQPLLRLQAHRAPLLECDISEDGSRAFTLDAEGNAFLWYLGMKGVCDVLQASVPAGQEQNDMDHAIAEMLTCCELTDDGRTMAVGYADGSLRLWGVGANIRLRHSHKAHKASPIECLALVKGKGMVASGDRDGCIVLTIMGLPGLGDFNVAAVIQGHRDAVTGLACCRDGSMLLSSARDGTLCLWEDLDQGLTGGDLMSLEPSSALAGECSLAALPGPQQAPLHKPALKFAAPMENGFSGIHCCALSPTGDLAVAACLNGWVVLWPTTGSGQLPPAVPAKVQVSGVAATSLTFSEDGRYLMTGSRDGSVCILDVSNKAGQWCCKLAGNAAAITSVYFDQQGTQGKDRSDIRQWQAVTVCGRQAVTWGNLGAAPPPQDDSTAPQPNRKLHVADFIADKNDLFRTSTVQSHEFVAHNGLTLYDPVTRTSMFDLRDCPPGNSSLFRQGTVVLLGGVHKQRMVVYAPPDKTVSMLKDESSGIRCIDFSPDGQLLVSGSALGELCVYDMVHRQPIRSWRAHRRHAVTAVKFSRDSTTVFSCGEDAQFLQWQWRSADEPLKPQPVAKPGQAGHQSPVSCVDMALDGKIMVSGDIDGCVAVWGEASDGGRVASWLTPHKGAVLSVSVSVGTSGDGPTTMIISSGADSQVYRYPYEAVIVPHIAGKAATQADMDIIAWPAMNDALGCKGLTAKQSYDGTRAEIGTEKGQILIWNMVKDCLMYDIQAHQGIVADCAWSDDGRRLLSVGKDSVVRLWDAAAGSELCQVNFETGLTSFETSGFAKCDLSADGTTMAGCTNKGQLFVWDIGQELRKVPDGCMLYQWLVSLPLASEAQRVFEELLLDFPLLFNTQDSRGLTVLMHAVANKKPDLVKMIIDTIPAKQRALGLMASSLRKLPGALDEERESTEAARNAGTGAMNGVAGFAQQLGKTVVASGQSAAGRLRSLGVEITGGSMTGRFAPDLDDAGSSRVIRREPNAIRIAIDASSSECVHHLLNAVLDEKVTPGSYHSVTTALAYVAQQYPAMCDAFLSGLPLRVLGEMEIPRHFAENWMHSSRSFVLAARSYTSYQELWRRELNLNAEEKGSMVVMEAVMVSLPFLADIGKADVGNETNEHSESLLHVLEESNVPVRTYGSDTIRALITYKWKNFARKSIHLKMTLFMIYVSLFIAYAIIISDDVGPLTVVYNEPSTDAAGVLLPPTVNSTSGADWQMLVSYGEGRACVALSFLVFFFGAGFLGWEILQMTRLNLGDYFSSYWNVMDLAAFTISMIIPPCVLLRYQMQDGGFVYPLVAFEVLLLTAKSLFYAMAVDGLGTFVYMIIEIIKGLKFFYILLIVMFISFGAALLNLLRPPPSGKGDFVTFAGYGTFADSLLSLFLSMLQNQDARGVQGTMWAPFTIIVCCLYTLLANIILINLIITLMNDLYSGIKEQQDLVFLRNRAGLILEVESTMEGENARDVPPYLHLLRPVNLEDKREEARLNDQKLEDERRNKEVMDLLHEKTQAQTRQIEQYEAEAGRQQDEICKLNAKLDEVHLSSKRTSSGMADQQAKEQLERELQVQLQEVKKLREEKDALMREKEELAATLASQAAP